MTRNQLLIKHPGGLVIKAMLALSLKNEHGVIGLDDITDMQAEQIDKWIDGYYAGK